MGEEEKGERVRMPARSSFEGNAPMNVKGKGKRERVNGDTSKEHMGDKGEGEP